MSDPTPAVDPAADPNGAPAAQGDPATAADAPLGEGGEKALKAEREARKAAETSAAALQKQLDDINAANLSDLEKAQKAATEAQESAAKATTEALRYRIAAETGITENVDLILTAPDEQTMRAQAALWGQRTSTGPKPDLSQGPKGTPASGSPEQDFANFLGSQMSRG